MDAMIKSWHDDRGNEDPTRTGNRTAIPVAVQASPQPIPSPSSCHGLTMASTPFPIPTIGLSTTLHWPFHALQRRGV
ncbi:hypothetical protein, partial [Pannonibacter carbonis]|uniref:hypothetical protein n=1 Tax=Pannonibacter carbonis TaxID=2067569 RepID=UPI001AD8E354